MRIGFVGAGKVGFTLGKYMSERNVCVSGYYSRSEESARQASLFTHTKYYETLEELIESSDALFLTVPDGAIEDVWNSILYRAKLDEARPCAASDIRGARMGIPYRAKLDEARPCAASDIRGARMGIKRYSLAGKFICHCSGVMTSAVFSEIDQMGAFGYSIHPLFAIHSKSQSYQEISQAYFTIEGPEAYLDFWKDFFEKLGNPVRVIQAEQKVLYHGAAVFASNLVTGLFEAGVDLLMDCGFDRESGEAALKPLFLHNCQSVAYVGTTAALTGPVERADEKTIQKHLKVLPPEEREIYIRLSEILVNIAKRKHPERDYHSLSQIFERNGEVK